MEFFGRELKKSFKDIGIFTGKVVDYHRTTGYRVEYEDGDSEDLTHKELLKVLTVVKQPVTKVTAAVVPVTSQLGKLRVPSITLDQFIKGARAGARRKRKHTELKRSGVLEQRRQRAEEKRAAAAAEEEAVRNKAPLHECPPWAESMSREGRVVKLDMDQRQLTRAVLDEHDCSMYRLSLEVSSPLQLSVRWWFPPANPRNNNAWLGMFRRDSLTWHEEYGAVESGSSKVMWKMIASNDRCGVTRFPELKDSIADGEYVVTMQVDYGTEARAVSEIFTITGGKLTTVVEGTLATPCTSIPRKQRQLGASLGLLALSSAEKDDEVMDERCYFPVTAVDICLRRDYMDSHPLLKSVHRIVDKESFLDWGLSSDYNLAERVGPLADQLQENDDNDNHHLRKRQVAQAPAPSAAPPSASSQYSAILPSAAQHAKRFHAGKTKLLSRGLGGGALGSEGYGEATMGSTHKIGVMLCNLRHLVLDHLYDTNWGVLWDLGPHSSFLDIGSGYGKVVLHLRLMSRMRVSVGYECVASRDQIAKKAMFALEAEVPAAGAMADSDSATNTRTGSGCTDVTWVPQTAFSGVRFEHQDATTYEKLAFTHIYIFDWVFSKDTLNSLAKVLQRSPFYVLVSFRSCTEWWSYGLVKIQPVAKLPGFRTSGKESMTAWVYLNLEKVPTA